MTRPDVTRYEVELKKSRPFVDYKDASNAGKKLLTEWQKSILVKSFPTDEKEPGESVASPQVTRVGYENLISMKNSLGDTFNNNVVQDAEELWNGSCISFTSTEIKQFMEELSGLSGQSGQSGLLGLSDLVGRSEQSGQSGQSGLSGL